MAVCLVEKQGELGGGPGDEEQVPRNQQQPRRDPTLVVHRRTVLARVTQGLGHARWPVRR